MSQNKLQLVDPNKLNEILNLLKKDFETKKLLQGVVNPDEFKLNEAVENMESKKGNPIQGQKIIDFLKKKMC